MSFSGESLAFFIGDSMQWNIARKRRVPFLLEERNVMMKFTCAACALGLVMSAVPALAQTPPPPPPAEAKVSAMPYIMAAGMSDLFEIKSSQIALQKSQTPAVRQFATMLIKHHQKTTAATMKAAKKAGLTPMPPALDAGANASINELQQVAPADFDRVYLAQQIPAHQAALDLHQSYSTGGDQAPLRASAKAAVPIVKQHITAAMKLQKTGDMSPHSM
jgi:putative membrane protein